MKEAIWLLLATLWGKMFNEDEICLHKTCHKLYPHMSKTLQSPSSNAKFGCGEHFNANAALAEERAAAAEAEATAKDEAMSKVGEETPEEDKAASDKEYDAQTAKTNAVNAKEHIQRVLGLIRQVLPWKMCSQFAECNRVDKSVFTDAATEVVSWALLKGMDLKSF